MPEFQLTDFEDYSKGFTAATTSAEWEGFFANAVPDSLHPDVTRRLISNLKHVTSSLDIQAGLIIPHGERGSRAAGRAVIFEPYFNTLILNFCIGAYSICEGLGAGLVLDARSDDGSTGTFIRKAEWTPSLIAAWGAGREADFEADLTEVIGTRDLIHQDKLGLRDDIDWHAISYDVTFQAGMRVIRSMIGHYGGGPADSNLG